MNQVVAPKNFTALKRAIATSAATRDIDLPLVF